MALQVHPTFSHFVLLLVFSVSFVALFLIYPTFLSASSTSGKANFSCFDFSKHDDSASETYRLFGTKTTYLTAREEIRKVFKAQWPLNSSQQCSPTYLFFLNRHSIRFPSVKEIRRFGELLPTLRDEFIAGGRLNSIVLREMFNWKMLINEVDENRVSLSGKLETAITAQIFYKYFPSLLDINQVNFEVGVTPKVRTSETAEAFIRSLIELQIGRNASSYEQSNLRVEEIMKKKFPNEEKDILMSHKKCKKMMENNPPPKHPKEYNKFAQSEAFSNLLTSFSVRNGLRFSVTFDTLVVIYRACSYEMAIYRYSPWCHLFSNSELKVIDYLMDISEYFDAYGTEAHRRLACTVIRDLYGKLDSVMKGPHSTQPKNATLYFSHENLLSKVISFFELFKHFPDHDHSGEHLCLPTDREWRSSLAVPFGTNFAAVLYRCGQETESATFKLLTLLNEIPVKIRGCHSELCDIEHFFKEYLHVTESCDLKSICR